MAQAQLKSSAEVQRKDLRGLVDIEEEDEFEALGFCEWSSTGEVYPPREWLEERWEYYNLPETFFPSEVWPSSAFKRTMKYLQNHEFDEMYIQGRKAKFRMEEGDGFIRHVYLDIFYSEDEIGTEGGDWRKTNLGFFNYDGTTQKLQYHTEAEGEIVEREWNKLIGKAQGLYKKMKRSHNGQDLNRVLLEFVQEDSTAVPLRQAGAVYFFPAQYQDILEGLSKIWEEMNQFKEIGKQCEIITLPVVDSEKHRDMIRKKAEELINSKVESVVNEAVTRLSEKEDETAEEIAESVVEELDDTVGVAQEYSVLLETQLSVKRNIEKYLESLEGEKEELVEKIAEEVEI